MFGCISKEIFAFNLPRVIVFCPTSPEHFIPFQKGLICHDLTFLLNNDAPHPLLSPICALEPIQGSSQWRGRMEQALPDGTSAQQAICKEPQGLQKHSAWKEFPYLFEKAIRTKMGQNVQVLSWFYLLFKLLKISTHACSCYTNWHQRVQSLLIFSCT